MWHRFLWHIRQVKYLIIAVATVIFFHASYGIVLTRTNIQHLLKENCFIKQECIILLSSLMHRALMWVHLILMLLQEIMQDSDFYIIAMVHGMENNCYQKIGWNKQKHHQPPTS